MKEKSYIIITFGVILTVIGRIIYAHSYWPGYGTVEMSDGSMVSIHGLPYYYNGPLSLAIIFISSGLLMILGPLMAEILKRENKSKVIKKILSSYLISSYLFILFLINYNYLLNDLSRDENPMILFIWFIFAPVTALLNLCQCSFSFDFHDAILGWVFFIMAVGMSILIIKLYKKKTAAEQKNICSCE